MGSLETELSLLVGEDPLHKTIAPPLEYRFQTPDIHEINTNAKDHEEVPKVSKMRKMPKVENPKTKHEKTKCLKLRKRIQNTVDRRQNKPSDAWSTDN